jgi:hypothetical protein
VRLPIINPVPIQKDAPRTLLRSGARPKKDFDVTYIDNSRPEIKNKVELLNLFAQLLELIATALILIPGVVR